MAGLWAKCPSCSKITGKVKKDRLYKMLSSTGGALRAKMPHGITFAFLAM
jgi:hypothetical protein